MPLVSKKKSTSGKTPHLAANRRRRRARRNPGELSVARVPRSNPGIVADFTHVLLPGFGAYAVTRLFQRIVWNLVGKRWPGLAKHAHALSGAAAFGGVWYFGHKVKFLAPYHDAIVMGSGIAAIQGIGQDYIPPRYAWILNDCNAATESPSAPQLTTSATPAPNAATPAQTADDEYAFLEADLQQLVSKKPSAKPVAKAMNAAAGKPSKDVELDADLIAELTNGEGVDDLYTGSFSNDN
jgi:hypothetical protein